MLSPTDQVLVSLIVKNTNLGDARVAEFVSAWEAEKSANSGADLAHWLVEKGHVSRTHMFKLVKARNFALLRKEDKRIVRRAVRKAYITRTQMNDALNFQKQLFRALGDIKRLQDILVDDSKLTRTQVDEIWTEYKLFLERSGERPVVTTTDPSLLKRQG
ncbi:MAG: hypothetical protein L6Q71_06570 [Planctomycetes bacterium]|nr:hypothetical protein [Planctomycetota bacterium]NUQ34347.1 hypothetical protein [Planctomycetaceae bacterium]